MKRFLSLFKRFPGSRARNARYWKVMVNGEGWLIPNGEGRPPIKGFFKGVTVRAESRSEAEQLAMQIARDELISLAHIPPERQGTVRIDSVDLATLGEALQYRSTGFIFYPDE